MPEVFTFAVYPEGGASFDPFLLEVPSLSGRGFAARRAWWSVFHLLGPRGIEPEQYRVNVWEDEQDGPVVGSGGIIDPVADLTTYLEVPRG